MARRGTGSVYQRKDGRWVAAFMVDGKKITRYAKDKADAKQRLADLRREVSALPPQRKPSVPESPPTSTAVTVARFADMWLASASLKVTTVEAYRNALSTHILPALGKKHIDAVTPSDVAGMVAAVFARGRASKTAQNAYGVLRRLLQVAMEWGLIVSNPAERVKRPRWDREEREVWTVEQARSFLATCRERVGLWDDFYTVLLLSGLRMGELLGLEWRDIDWDAGTISVKRTLGELFDGTRVTQTPKSKASVRTVSLPVEAIDVLRNRRERETSPACFRRIDGLPPSNNALRCAFERTCHRAGVPYIGIHGLRHMHISLLAHAGIPVRAVQLRVGHSDPSITLRIYTHELGDSDAKTTEALDAMLGEPKPEPMHKQQRLHPVDGAQSSKQRLLPEVVCKSPISRKAVKKGEKGGRVIRRRM